MSTPKHCPGFEGLKSLQSFICKCPEYGYQNEIFSDEFDRERVCRGCKKKIDFTKCKLEASS